MTRQLKKIWNMKVKTIPLVIGALGTTAIKLRNWIKEIGIETKIIELQKTALLHTAQILQKVLRRQLQLLRLLQLLPLPLLLLLLLLIIIIIIIIIMIMIIINVGLEVLVWHPAWAGIILSTLLGSVNNQNTQSWVSENQSSACGCVFFLLFLHFPWAFVLIKEYTECTVLSNVISSIMLKCIAVSTSKQICRTKQWYLL